MLKTDKLKEALKKANEKARDAETPEEANEIWATELSQAIEAFVKSGEVQVNTGISVQVNTGTGTGSTISKGKGKIL